MKQLANALRRITSNIDISTRNLVKNYNLTIQQYMILKFLNDYEEPVNQANIAKYFNKTPATLTSVLKLMEKNEYIKRVVDKNNERQKVISLTSKGTSILKQTTKKYDEIANVVEESLTQKEMSQLIELLDKVSYKIEEYNG